MTKITGVQTVLLPLLFSILKLSPTATCFVSVSKCQYRAISPITRYSFLSSNTNTNVENDYTVSSRSTSLFVLHAKQKKNTNSDDDDSIESITKADVITLDNAGDPLRADELEWLADRDLLRRAVNSPGGQALTNRDPVGFFGDGDMVVRDVPSIQLCGERNNN